MKDFWLSLKNAHGFSLVEILAVLGVIGILVSIGLGKNAFLGLLSGPTNHAWFPILADRLAPQMCSGANEDPSNGFTPELCLRFGKKNCNVTAREVVIACLKVHKQSIPPTLTPEEERLLMQLAGPCIQRQWIKTINSLEMNLQNKKCAAGYEKARKNLNRGRGR